MRFPEFTEEWLHCTLGDITTNFNLRNKNEVEYPMYSVTNNRGFIPQSEQFEDREMLGEDIKAYKIIHKDDFAYNPARINVGSIAKYDGEQPCMISSLYVCFKTNPQIYNDWMAQLLKTPKMNYYYNTNGEGGVRIYLFYPNFARIRTSYPATLSEQKKIAHFLTLLDERIATQNKIIEKYESLIQAIIYQKKVAGIRKGDWQKTELSNVLKERIEKNTNGHIICSVSVSKGVVNQIEYLGRSFAAKETLHYNVVKYGDIVYTKSPTGDFPYGIVKRSYIKDDVAVSPLYGVYMPVNDYIGVILHFYFMQPSNTFNYLHPLIQKGAKNTINITNERFLKNSIPLPKTKNEAIYIANTLINIQKKIDMEKKILRSYEKEKQYLLSKMFI